MEYEETLGDEAQESLPPCIYLWSTLMENHNWFYDLPPHVTNSIFGKYKVVLVVKQYFEVAKTHFIWMKMGVQGKEKLNKIFEN